MLSHAKFYLWSLWFLPLLFLVPSPTKVQPPQDVTQVKSVTGCLQKGEEPGGFFIVENGRMWELVDRIEPAHVGKTVRVTGHYLLRPEAEEAKFAEFEKREAQGLPYADFQVLSLKVIRNSCK